MRARSPHRPALLAIGAAIALLAAGARAASPPPRNPYLADSSYPLGHVPLVSLAGGAVYLIGARNDAWTLEALDWATGHERFHFRIGGQRYNSLFSGTLLDEAGRIHYGTHWGRVRLDPAAD